MLHLPRPRLELACRRLRGLRLYLRLALRGAVDLLMDRIVRHHGPGVAQPGIVVELRVAARGRGDTRVVHLRGRRRQGEAGLVRGRCGLGGGLGLVGWRRVGWDAGGCRGRREVVLEVLGERGMDLWRRRRWELVWEPREE
jgi:hypothetical protein